MLASSDPSTDASTLADLRQEDGQWQPRIAADEETGDALYDRLVELKHLPQNWDGEGAVPIREDIIQAVWDFLQAVTLDLAGPLSPVAVVPMPNGSLELEWAYGNRILQLEFESPETIHYLKWDSDRGVQSEGFVASDDMPAARAMLEWFHTTMA
jgi:hypothetical protein